MNGDGAIVGLGEGLVVVWRVDMGLVVVFDGC